MPSVAYCHLQTVAFAEVDVDPCRVGGSAMVLQYKLGILMELALIRFGVLGEEI